MVGDREVELCVYIDALHIVHFEDADPSAEAEIVTGTVTTGSRPLDPAKQDALAAQIHAKAVDDAVMIWIYHDRTPRALSSRIKSYTQAQSWFQDLALVEM